MAILPRRLPESLRRRVERPVERATKTSLTPASLRYSSGISPYTLMVMRETIAVERARRELERRNLEASKSNGRRTFLLGAVKRSLPFNGLKSPGSERLSLQKRNERETPVMMPQAGLLDERRAEGFRQILLRRRLT